ncbi:beta-ketoacyl-[acyl-carrier-protein] synthase family protein [Streptomyces sp. NPDC004528]|uniref:beta-ketoacyl-[acyl-carrier-protein] synthase family protein n=1 Tax=Streptomyces sp. NPDC004528 TaxID=3154550 RepID=UPI0033A861C6
MRYSFDVPPEPHALVVAEVAPGDLLALSGQDLAENTWYVVMRTLAVAPGAVRLTLRPPLGGRDRDVVLERGLRVSVGCRRVDLSGIPELDSSDLGAVEFRDGDRVGSLRAVDPRAVEESYIRKWGRWYRDSDSEEQGPVSDAELRERGARDLERGHLVRHRPRPRRSAEVRAVRRVVVTGLGAVTPLGVGAGELWRGLLEGRCGIRELAGEEFAGLPVRIAGTVPVDPARLLPRPQARRMNRAARFAVLAAREAWEDAGLDPAGTEESGLPPERVGVSVGSILGDASVLVGGDRALRERGPRAVSPLTTPMTVPSQAASQVSLALRITGEARTVTSACASGTEAVGQAVDRIRHGRVDLALAGGAEAVVTPAIMASFAAMRALSAHPAGPTSPSRPFAGDRDGFVNGEGAGFLLLEAEEHARARGARVYCEAAGWGLSADAHHLAAPDPSGRGIALALRRAVEDSGAHVLDVVHVNAHATATVDGDLAEADALRAVFGARVPVVTALKGHLGHLQGAAGGVEAVATVLTLHHGLIPPTIGCDVPDDAIGLDVVTKSPRPLPSSGDLALSNSFGFGGHNAVVAFRRRPA